MDVLRQDFYFLEVQPFLLNKTCFSCLIQLGGQDGWGGKQNCEQEPDLSFR